MKKSKSDIHNKAAAYVYSVLSMALTVFCVVIVLYTFVLRAAVVSGDSMYPTLANGSVLAVSAVYPEPQRGDVIAFGREGAEESSMIKRVIGVPGDVVSVNAATHIITVNGEVLTDGFDPVSEAGDVTYPVTVPDNCVFVLGDNRNNSLDSRFSEIGLVRYDEIVGKAVFSLFPPGKLG